LRYNTQIDDLLVYLLYPDLKRGYNELYREVALNYKSISYETFDFHIKNLSAKILRKEDSGLKSRKVNYSLTDYAKRQVMLKIFESTAEREKYNFLKDSYSRKMLKLYFLILLGPYPETDEPEEELIIEVSEDKFNKIMSKSTLRHTDLRIIKNIVYDEKTPRELEDQELAFYRELNPTLSDLDFNFIKGNLKCRPILSRKILRLERISEVRGMDILNSLSDFFRITRHTTLSTPDNFIIKRYEYGLKADECKEKLLRIVNYELLVNGFTISHIINQKKRKFFPRMQFTKEEALQALNIIMEDNIISVTRFVRNRYFIRDPELELFLNQLAKNLSSMLYRLTNLALYFRPTAEEHQYLEYFLGKDKIDILFRRNHDFKHSFVQTNDYRKYQKQSLKRFLDAQLRFLRTYSNIIIKYEVPLKAIIDRIYPEPLIKVLLNKVGKLPATTNNQRFWCGP
jgi:hypothetical protein